jgi:hypothetical protein
VEGVGFIGFGGGFLLWFVVDCAYFICWVCVFG